MGESILLGKVFLTVSIRLPQVSRVAIRKKIHKETKIVNTVLDHTAFLPAEFKRGRERNGTI